MPTGNSVLLREKPQAQVNTTCVKACDTKSRFDTWPNCSFDLNLSQPVRIFLVKVMEVICHSGLSPSPEEEETTCLRKKFVLLSFTKWCPGRKESESESCSVVSDFLWPHGLYSSWNSPGQNTGVGSLFLLQRFFPIQGSNPGLPHCRRVLYQLSHKGSPRILELVAYPFSRGSSRPRNQTGVSCTAGGFFTNWTIREVLLCWQLRCPVLLLVKPSTWGNPSERPFSWRSRCSWRILLLLCSHSVVLDSLWPHGALPGSSVHGISQARILAWVTISFFRGWIHGLLNKSSEIFRGTWLNMFLEVVPRGREQVLIQQKTECQESAFTAGSPNEKWREGKQYLYWC